MSKAISIAFILLLSREPLQQVGQIAMHAGARCIGDRTMQADDEVKPRQGDALQAEAFAHDTLHEISLRRTPCQLLCDNDAQASRIKFVGSIVHDQVLPFNGTPESKNG